MCLSLEPEKTTECGSNRVTVCVCVLSVLEEGLGSLNPKPWGLRSVHSVFMPFLGELDWGLRKKKRMPFDGMPRTTFECDSVKYTREPKTNLPS